MNRAHALLQNDDVRLFTSTVKGRCDNRYMLLSGGVMTTAVRAAGCLLQPEPGDTVLTASAEDGSAYILNVLVRGAASKESRITVPNSRMLFEADEIGIEPAKPSTSPPPPLNLRQGRQMEPSAP